MIKTLLIANRGEIACRIIYTAKKLGLTTIAVFSDADRNAKHVQLADQAFYIGLSNASESYLNAKKIIAAALTAKADAIHPGYGFLSENVEFAKLCQQNNIIFIGPNIKAIEAMGSKSAAKTIMAEANVPLIPGFHGDEQTKSHLLKQAQLIGFPLLIKAAFGGGGKGMRIVETMDELSLAIDSAKREAKSAFGNDKLLLEKYLVGPRHIEIQIFADSQGNFVYLSDRDCSIQRRHQKIIEEAPAPNLTPELRKQMGEAAIAATKAIDYLGAGTVEFLLDANGQDFYFMETNTRLQVEHPVTEMVTGQDLVEWQIAVAEGKPLPLTQNDIQINGHAFEARIYAEDPENDFLPDSGHLTYLQEPKISGYVRLDSGVCQGDEISNFYDPMVAKLICWGENRAKALANLYDALADYRILGIKNNIKFLRVISNSRVFKNAEITTNFIEDNKASLFNLDQQLTDNDSEFIKAKVITAFTVHLLRKNNHLDTEKNKVYSPWELLDGFRLNTKKIIGVEIWDEKNNDHAVQLVEEGIGYSVLLKGQKFSISGRLLDESKVRLCINGHQLTVNYFMQNSEITVFCENDAYSFRLKNSQLVDAEDEKDLSSTKASLKAPMNGTIVTHLVKPNDDVKKGQGLMVMEAMKMEYTIYAPTNGKVTQFYYQKGDLVEDGALLVEFEPM